MGTNRKRWDGWLRCTRLVALAAAVGAAALVTTRVWAAPKGEFKDANLKGNYLCNLDGDELFENSIIQVSADGKGNLTADEVHVSTDFEGSGCNGVACICKFTGTASTTVNTDGTGLTTWTWTPSGGNPSPCPASEEDTWAYVLGSGGKSFFVASANSGFEAEPAIGGCSSAP